MDAAKKIVRTSFKTSKDLFNEEVSALRRQYKRMLTLVDHYEGSVYQQAALIALQEQVETKLSCKLFAQKIDEAAHADAVHELHKDPQFDKAEMLERMKWMSVKQTSLYKHEPFEFYGGNLHMSKKDTQTIKRDHIYMTQEIKIADLRYAVEQLESSVAILTDQNKATAEDHTAILEKYKAKKRKIKQERVNAQKRLEEMEESYKQKLRKCRDVIENLHTRQKNFKTFADIERRCAKGIAKALKGRIEMYKETAKQAKAVLRIPRLCHTYHNKIKHLNEEQASKLLEELFNEYYAATKERRRGNNSVGYVDPE